MNFKTTNVQGFTLIELIIVITIISIIMAVGIPVYINLIDDAHMSNMDKIVGTMRSAIVLSASDSLFVNDYYATPVPGDVTIANMIHAYEIDTSDWSDNGSGVWTYAPTNGTITYVRIDTENYRLDIEYGL